jgi:hypothetical protein
MSERRLGPLVSSWSFEAAAQRLLVADSNLIGLYSDEIARQLGEVTRIERPRSVLVRETVTRFAEDQLPGLLLRCRGTASTPERSGDGLYSADWSFSVIAITQGTDVNVTRSVACDLCAAATAILIHYLPRVDSRIIGVRWDGEDSEEIDLQGDERSRSVVGRGLLISVQDILCDLSGLPADWDIPDPPIGQPPLDSGDLLTVESADVVSATPTNGPV